MRVKSMKSERISPFWVGGYPPFQHLTIIISDKYLFIMAKIGYIIAISLYARLEEDRKWMNNYGCIRIVEESDEN